MSKLILLIISLLFTSAAIASKCLSIALLNKSQNTVKFSTAVDPGYIPKVNPGQNYTLPGDFTSGCLQDKGKKCVIFINPIVKNAPKTTAINNVPKGTRIIYSGPNKYFLDKNANVRCP